MWERDTHMVRGAMFPIKWFGDKHLSQHRVDIEHLIGRLVCSNPSDAVPDWDVLVLVRTDLHQNKHRGPISRSVSQRVSVSHTCFHLYFSLELSHGLNDWCCRVFSIQGAVCDIRLNNFVLYTILETWYCILFMGNTTHTYFLLPCIQEFH